MRQFCMPQSLLGLEDSGLSYYCRTVSAILIVLIVMGCTGLTAFRTSGEQVVCTTMAYYSAADNHESLLENVVHSAHAIFASVSGPTVHTYIGAPRATNGEYIALLFNGQIITVPQLRGDSSDGSAQIAKLSHMQPVRFAALAKQKTLPTPLHLTTKENVELLM